MFPLSPTSSITLANISWFSAGNRNAATSVRSALVAGNHGMKIIASILKNTTEPLILGR
jgi:hypothetical protein